jgi:hypothetical protein
VPVNQIGGEFWQTVGRRLNVHFQGIATVLPCQKIALSSQVSRSILIAGLPPGSAMEYCIICHYATRIILGKILRTACDQASIGSHEKTKGHFRRRGEIYCA